MSLKVIIFRHSHHAHWCICLILAQVKILSCWKSGCCIRHHLWTLSVDNPSALDKSWIVAHQFSKISFFICAALAFIYRMLDLSVWSLPWIACLTICKLFTVFWLMYLHYTFAIAVYQLAILSIEETYFTIIIQLHYELLHGTKFPVSLPLQINLYPK